jgi:glyoxylase-like metal-dependent hydrolase (beta-lactamase superfamily II)
MQTHDEGSFRLIKVGPLGPFNNNAYVIVDPAAGEAAIVDMPAEGERILEAAAGLRVGKILLTHTHPDH